MKRMLIALLIIALVFCSLLAGCDEPSPEPPKDNSTIHMYLIGGQSNAVGISPISTAIEADMTQTFPNVLYAGETDRNVTSGSPTSSFGITDTRPNSTPAASYSDTFVEVRAGLGRESRHFGPEYGMAEVFNGRYEGNRKAFFFKSAAGGTSLRNVTTDYNSNLYGNWHTRSFVEQLPENQKDALRTGALYNRFVENFANVYQKLVDSGERVKVKGMVWMQGESDRDSSAVIASYPDLLGAMIRDLREDLCEITGDSTLMNMPFIAGEISDTHNSALPATVEVNQSFNLMLNNLAESGDINDFYVAEAHDMPQNRLVNGVSVSLGEDIWHWIADYQVELGNRFANKLIEVIG